MADVDEQMRRLYLAGWLTRRAGEALSGSVAEVVSREDLERAAAALARIDRDAKPLAGLHFNPPYPGRVVDDGSAPGPDRWVLECEVSRGGNPLGVVLTVLIPGRRPEVSVAPPETQTG